MVAARGKGRYCLMGLEFGLGGVVEENLEMGDCDGCAPVWRYLVPELYP